MSKPPKSRAPLRAELAALKAKIQREDIRLGEIERQFWEDGGICCPCCGVPGFSEAEMAQERRWSRVRDIEKKLQQSPGPKEGESVPAPRSLTQVIANLFKGTP